MEDKRLWLETDYFEKFRCKGGACRNSCCEGWKISVSMKEYFDLIGMDCSEKLHRRLESAFIQPENPDPENYRQIAPNWLGMCPMHDEDGLCMLHRECGADALPEICRVYPRSLKNECGVNQACCSSSCEAVIETLMDEDQLHFRLAKMDAVPEYSENADTDLLQIGSECMWALQNRNKGIQMRIADICALCGCDAQIDMDAETALKKLADSIGAIEESSASMLRFGQAAVQRYNAGGMDAYRADIAAFEAAFPGWERWFENILANHLLYMDFPFVDGRIDRRQACEGLCLAYGLMKCVCAAYCADHPSREDAADALAGVFRLIEHSPFYYNARLFGGAQALLQL